MGGEVWKKTPTVSQRGKEGSGEKTSVPAGPELKPGTYRVLRRESVAAGHSVCFDK